MKRNNAMIYTSSSSLSWALIFGNILLHSVAQEPQETHPWLTECDQYGCFTGYYCNYTSTLCESCPDIGESCTFGDNETVQDCQKSCYRSQEGQACSAETTCQDGVYFCDFENNSTGTCRACKENVQDCLTDDSLTSDYGKQECLLCDLKCVPLHFSETTVDSEPIPSNALLGSPLANNTSGNLVDCTNLVHESESLCENATDSICLVEDYTRNTYYVDVVNKCADSGGVAVIMFGDFTPRTPNDKPWQGSLSFKETTIPSVSISYNDGIRMRQEQLNSTADVSVYSVGDYCVKEQYCSETIPCIGTNEGKYCDFKWGGDVGFCRDCPVDEDGNDNPLGCFFSFGDTGRVQGQLAVESCATNCASSLEFSNCKLCPRDITGFDFGVDPGEEQCNFCPENDVLYLNQSFPLFGEGVECWQVQKFFKSVEVSADAPNCRLAQMMNYVCGCQGPGYGGASSDTKKVVLAWLPRAMAILSLLGSLFVIYDASKSKAKRQKLLHQLLITLSIFDIVGSCAYALTTLPIPQDDLIPVYGARGNEGTCTAQGFFIRMGTTSCFTNVSLAVYYLLAIKYGQAERQLKEKRRYLVALPILVGLAFALAGIPFYGNMILWCDNTASWWPDVPVVIAIVSATVIMGIVCWDVYKKEKASARWRGGGDIGRARNKLSHQVFWQSFFYLMAFYLTWPAYIVLQYAWAADNFFAHYGLLLAAGTMVPLQGFWNFIVYIRPRQYKQASTSLRRASTRFLGRRLQTTQDMGTRSFMMRRFTFRPPTSQTVSTRNTSEATPVSSRQVTSGNSASHDDNVDVETKSGQDKEAAISIPVKDESDPSSDSDEMDSPIGVSFGSVAIEETKVRGEGTDDDRPGADAEEQMAEP